MRGELGRRDDQGDNFAFHLFLVPAACNLRFPIIMALSPLWSAPGIPTDDICFAYLSIKKLSKFLQYCNEKWTTNCPEIATRNQRDHRA